MNVHKGSLWEFPITFLDLIWGGIAVQDLAWPQSPGKHVGTGIGGYDLATSADQVFAYDYDGSGKLDHLALYRPGTGTIWILKNTSGTFQPVS